MTAETDACGSDEGTVETDATKPSAPPDPETPDEMLARVRSMVSAPEALAYRPPWPARRPIDPPPATLSEQDLAALRYVLDALLRAQSRDSLASVARMEDALANMRERCAAACDERAAYAIYPNDHSYARRLAAEIRALPLTEDE